jgi:hypothetical protein
VTLISAHRTAQSLGVVLTLVLASLVLQSPSAVQTASAQPVVGVGVLGDSNSDEYRGDDCRACGTRYEPTTLNWVELLARYRDVSFGPWGTWGTPRRTGYLFNWAQSGATAQDAIAGGQHTGLAEQITHGLVSTVVISVGANNYNDWNGTYGAIYDGQLSGTALTDYETTIVGDITLAMDTVQGARPSRVIWNPIPDMSADAYLQNEFPSLGQRQRVTDSYTRVNSRLTLNAQARGITVVDVQGETTYALAHFSADHQFILDGQPLDITNECWSPNCLIMPDHHVGTIGQGLYANFYFLLPLGMPPFTEHELIANAGFPQ